MDYGIIFIIILVIVIIIAIILIIYANRNNITNILKSFPSYRIQNNNDINPNNYLGLRNCTTYTPGIQEIPIEGIYFWESFVSSGLNNKDSIGIWKIENIEKNNKIPIVTGSKVKLINFVYNVQSVNQLSGYLEQAGTLINNKILFHPNASFDDGITFVYNLVGNNLFSLKAEFNNKLLPVVVDRTNNFLGMSTNINDKPTIFKLDFQQQK